MKSIRISVLLIVLFAALFSAPKSHAISSYFWDINGMGPGAGGASPSGYWIGEAPKRLYDPPSDYLIDAWKTLPPDVQAQYIIIMNQHNDALFGSGNSWFINKFVNFQKGYEQVYGPYTDGGFADVFFSNGADATGAYTITVLEKRQARRLYFNSGTVTLEGTLFEFLDGNGHDDKRIGSDSGVIGVGDGRTAYIKVLALLRDDRGETANGLPAGITKIDKGTLVMVSTNFHKGPIRIEGGVLQLGATQVFDAASHLVMANGGENNIINTPATFKPSGFNQSFNLLRVEGKSAVIDFEGADSDITFAASGSQDWKGNYLTIRNMAAGDSIKVGTDATGLGVNIGLIEFSDIPIVGNSAPGKIDSQGFVIPNADAPVIKVHPKSLTVGRGKMMELTVELVGTGPFTYQWQQNGVDLAGQRASTLSVPTFLDEHTGEYRVKVSNAAGTTRSAAALLKIVTPQAGPPVITSLKYNSNMTTTVTWEATAYRSYVLEYSYLLGDLAGWTDASDAIVATTSTATFVDQALEATDEQRFYRVRLVEPE